MEHNKILMVMLEHNVLVVIWTFGEKNGNKKIVRLQGPFQINFKQICSEEDQPLFIKKTVLKWCADLKNSKDWSESQTDFW